MGEDGRPLGEEAPLRPATTLTGAHALHTGEIATDVNQHLDAFGFSEARELIDQKRRGELAELPEPLIERWRGQIGRAFELLDAALQSSPLPDDPPNVRDLDEWLLAVRRKDLGGFSGSGF